MPPECTHLDAMLVTELPGPPLGCEECLRAGDTWMHLRMCLTCGNVGCCDASPNRHARAHSEASGHPLMRSAEPGEDWAWCFVDEVVVVLREHRPVGSAPVEIAASPELVPASPESVLALAGLRLEGGATHELGDGERDTLLYDHGGAGSIALAGETAALRPGAAALVLAGERATVEAGADGLGLIAATVGPDADRHAPLGRRELIASLEAAGSEQATGARSFQILFGPHNGSTRATLFAGFIPPGKAPWHYHLYDEIVWVPEGPGRLHSGDTVTELGPGSAFRLRPREVHIVENASPERELTVIGIFTPAGSPSAAYLEPDVAAEYRFAG